MATFISWNCRGFMNKSSELKDIINKHNPACITLQETYLKTDKHYIRNYEIFSKHHIQDRASVGVALLAASHILSMSLNLNTNLQAVAIRIQMQSLVTVCSLYLPPSERISQTDLNNLISQLPSPFIILGYLNGHSPFWGSTDSNSRGLQIKHLLADHNLCLLNSDQKTHFHLPTRTFHSVDLAISSPSLLPFLNLTIDNDLYNSDHFPLIVTDNRHNPSNSYRPPKYILNAANWERFTSLSNINSETIKSSSIEQALSYIVNTIIETADNSIPKTLGKRRKQSKPWWNADCQQAYKKQRKAWDIFRRYPTTENFINFKKKRKQNPEESSGAVAGLHGENLFHPSLQQFQVVICGRKLKRLQMFAISCLASVHDSSPGPDSFTYSMIKHLTTESQDALLHFYSRIWQEQYFPTLWQQAIIIPLLKPGKDPKNPSNYRPIALTCCLCKLLERMINRRLVYYLEANKYLHPFQSGFRKGRSTIDNLLALETDIRLSFLQRKHLVAIFFDIEKAYDRSWRYGILKDLHDQGLRGNLRIFIKKFLKLKKFRVKVESKFSDFFIQEEGVPQGSVLV
ncbi:putative RNA-directed DNA polymerase from transposon X-element [Araneus ventricosus]|uniref:Putative RNA-directed DNA polymerase from transposon X-element n=1 Tax=Araneus ventricosus TaxID=182803 RepID=A0A4Y2BII3_ARAVE|nr:putative RNA-directed DNA polymerase from transposon X-element [Araneus ventricosus]